MKRTVQNVIIDSIGFAAFVFLTTTGVLVRYVLPPGSGYHTTLWGMDRHEWGAVHFWIAVAFLGVMALHLFLHWRWIVCVIRGKPREGSGGRLALGAMSALAIVAVAFAPLAGSVERSRNAPPQRNRSGFSERGGERGRGQAEASGIERGAAAGIERGAAAGIEHGAAAGSERGAAAGTEHEAATGTEHGGEAVRGRMTLTEIEQHTGVPVAYIIEQLDLPADVPRNQGVAKLGRQYGYGIDDVRRIVSAYEKE